MSILAQNMQILRSEHPALAELIDAFPDKDKVIAFQAKDGGIAYGLRTTSGIQPITDHVNPLTRIGSQLTQNSTQLNDFSRPIMLVGLYPGDELLYLHDLAEKAPSQATQYIYVAIDSIACFYAFLQNIDANKVLTSPRVRFFMADQAPALANEFRENPRLSYLFTLISGSRNGTVNKVMTPFVNLVNERNAEFKRMLEQNKEYYDSIDDETLSNIICSKADRPPRLMTLTSSHSTVTQYSCRDLCAVMEKSGWQTERINIDSNPTPHYLVSRIHQFKPDAFLFVNHLRSEAPSVYPANMMFITWVQDTVPYINRHDTAEAWNALACGNREDHRPQAIDNRPKSESCTSPAPQGDTFPSASQRSEDPEPVEGLPSVCSACSSELLRTGERQSPSPPSSDPSPSQSMVYGLVSRVSPQPRKRDLIIGYTGLLKQYGYLEDRLCEMPMIVNPDIFKPRTLTPEQIEKYGCDIMFASNGSRPTEEIVRDTIVPAFAHLRPENRNQRTDVGSQRSEDRSESESCTNPAAFSIAFGDGRAPQGDPSPLQSSVCGLQSAVSLPPPLFSEALLLSIHDHLWTQYRAGRTFTSYSALEQELLSLTDHGPETIDNRLYPCTSPAPQGDTSPFVSEVHPQSIKDRRRVPFVVKNSPSQSNVHGLSSMVSKGPSFSDSYEALFEDDRDFVIQTLFWRLNDVIYRHAVLEWLDEIVTSGNSDQSSVISNQHGENSPSPSATRPEACATAQESASPLSSPLPSASSACSSELLRTGERQSPSSSPQSTVYSLMSNVCDRPAIAPLRLHLYGNGWEHHPRFAKYAKGPIAHGEELSIAYQAAKFCLHLNATEGMHQRLHEIAASHGHVLTRASQPITHSNNPPRSVMSQIAISHCSERDHADGSPLSKENEELLSDWIFNTASHIAEQDTAMVKDSCSEHIQRQVTATISQIHERLSWPIDNIEQHSFVDRKHLKEKLRERHLHRHLISASHGEEI